MDTNEIEQANNRPNKYLTIGGFLIIIGIILGNHYKISADLKENLIYLTYIGIPLTLFGIYLEFTKVLPTKPLVSSKWTELEEEIRKPSRYNWIITFGILIYLSFHYFIVPNGILTKDTIPKSYIVKLKQKKFIEAEEKIHFFVSSGDLSFQEGFILASDKAVVLYSDKENFELKVPYTQLRGIYIESSKEHDRTDVIYLLPIIEQENVGSFFLDRADEKQGDFIHFIKKKIKESLSKSKKDGRNF